MMVEESNERRRRDKSRSRSPAKCRSRGPQKKRPLRKTQSTPTTTITTAPAPAKKTAMDPFNVPASSTATALFSSSFSDFGSASMDLLPSSFHGAFPDDGFGFSSNHSSFPLTAKRQTKVKAKGRTATGSTSAKRGTPRRTMSHGTGVAKSKRHNTSTGSSTSDPNDPQQQQQRVSLEDLHKERRRLSLLLGDEQFPADDVSAVLGDLSSSASASDFPGINLQVARKMDKKKNMQKTKSQTKPTQTGTKKRTTTLATTKDQSSKPNTSKDKEEAKNFHDFNNASQSSLFSAASNSSVASAATIAALEALEHSARGREKGVLAKRLQETRRRHLMQQSQPGSQTTTTATTSSETTGTRSKVAPIHTQVPDKDDIDFYLELYNSSNRNDNPAGKKTSSSRSLSSGTNSKKKGQQHQPPKQPKTPPLLLPNINATSGTEQQKQPKRNPTSSHRQHLDLPPLRTFQSSISLTNTTPATAYPRESMRDESEMSLSLSDLQRSDRRSGGDSKGKSKSSNHSTATTINLSKSSMASSSSSLLSSSTSTSTTSRRRVSSKSKGAKPVGTTSLEEPVHVIPNQASSNGNDEQQQEQQHRSSETTSCLLESLSLDTLHENQHEESSETTSISRHSTAGNTVNNSGRLIMALPQEIRQQQTPIPSSLLSVPSFQQSATEELNAALQTSANPTKDKTKSKAKRSTDNHEDDQRSSKDSRKPNKTATTTKKKKAATKGDTKQTDKLVSSSSRKSSRGEDVANRRPDRHLTTSKTPTPQRRQRRKSGASVTDPNVEIHSHSLSDLPVGPRRGVGRNTLFSSENRHKSDRNLKYSEPMMPDDIPRGSQSTANTSRRDKRKEDQSTYHRDKPPRHCGDEPIWENGLYDSGDRYYHKAHDRHWQANDTELTYHRNVLLQRIDPERLYKVHHPGPPSPFSDHGAYFYYHGGYPKADMPHPTPSDERLAGLPNPASHWYNENAAFGHGNTAAASGGIPIYGKRRHSIGSGHSRDAVMHEVNAAMEQEYKSSTCGNCGHVIIRCHCNNHHHNLEPIVAISRSRHTRQAYDREAHLPSNKVKPVSLFDTFGIKYLDTEFREKTLCRGRLDEEVHSATLPSPGSVPLYHRPKGFEPNERLYSTRVGRVDTAEVASNWQHRGRKIVGRGLPAELSCENQQAGARDMTSAQESQGEFDDGSLKYPPRASSTSSRSLDLDDASFLSFAI